MLGVSSPFWVTLFCQAQKETPGTNGSGGSKLCTQNALLCQMEPSTKTCGPLVALSLTHTQIFSLFAAFNFSQDAEVELLEIRREILETAEVQELRFDRSEAVCTLADDPAEFQVV